jgi:oligopeptide transport system substrate-binding protein
MYQSGSLHSVLVPDGEWAPSMANPALAPQLHRALRQCTYYYGFNTVKAPFDDPQVRKAFIAAVDRQGLIDTVRQGPELVALTYAPPTTVGYTDGATEGIGIPYDVTQAQTWLAAAGYPGGAGLPPILLVYNSGTGHDDVASYVRQEWIDNLGVTVTLADLDWDTYLSLLEIDPPQIWRLGWCADQPDAWNVIFDGVAPTFFGGWSNPTYALLRVLASEEDDDATRFGYYQDVEEILVETDAIMLPLYYYARGMITDPDLVRGYALSGYGAHIEDWIYRNIDLFLPLIMR